jgi:hypothetical protein
MERGERDSFSWGQLAAAVGMSAIPGGKAAQVGGSIAKNVGKRAAQGAALGAGGQLVETAIDKGELPTLPEFLVATGGGALVGGALGGVEQKMVTKLADGNIINEITLGPMIEPVKRLRGDQDALVIPAEDATKRIKKALKTIPAAERQEANDRANSFLLGQALIEVVPTALRPHVADARNALDGLSDELVLREVVKGDLKETITNNKGGYMRRSYRVFHEGWEPDPDTFKKWVNSHVDGELADRAAKMRDRSVAAITDGVTDAKEVLSNPVFTGADRDSLVDKYTKIANELTYDRGKAHDFVLSGSLKVDSGIFKPRQDLDKLTMELMGVIDDPVYTIMDSAIRMSRTAAVFKAKKDMADIGVKAGLFVKELPLEQAAAGWWRKIAPDDAQFNPYAGYYTHPDINDALNRIHDNDLGEFTRFFMKLSGWAKMPKTLGNLKAYASNYWAAPLDVLAQGHGMELLRTSNWDNARRNTGFYLGFKGGGGSDANKANFKIYEGLVREGMMTKSTTFADFQDAFNAGQSGSAVYQKGFGAWMGAAVDKAGRVYSYPETMGKLFNLAGEMKAIHEAYPKLDGDAVFKQAAEKVRATTMWYDALWRGFRRASGIGFIDPFISFTADRFRIAFNTFSIGIQELKSGNPRMRRRGAERLASQMAVLGVAGTLGYNKALSLKEDEATRRQLPPWDKNGFIAVGKREGDSFAYTNLNYVIPQTITIEAMGAAMRGDDPVKALNNFTDVAINQLFGANLLLKPAIEAATGRTLGGREIRSETDSLPKKISDSSLYFLDETFVPLAKNEIMRGVASARGKEVISASGQQYRLDDALYSNFAGLRRHRINLPQSFANKSKQINRAISDDRGMYGSAKKKAERNGDTAGVDAAYGELLERHRKSFQTTVQLVEDARTLGYKEEQIASYLKEGKLPASMILGAMRGVYVPPEKEPGTSTREVYEKLAEGKTTSQQMSAVSQMASTNPQMARSIADMVKQQARFDARNVSEVDRLYLSLNATNGDRLDFIKQELAQLPEGPLRDIRVAELRKKGIITPLMSHQMQAKN